MKLRSVHVENFRAIRSLTVPLDPALTVLHGNNGHGKTSLLAAIAAGLGEIPVCLLMEDAARIGFQQSDYRTGSTQTRVLLTATDGMAWQLLRDPAAELIKGGRLLEPDEVTIAIWSHRLRKEINHDSNTDLPVIAFYDTDRATLDIPGSEKDFRREFNRYDAYEDALIAKTSFKRLVEWFFVQENRELRWQRNAKNFELRLRELEAVRCAITSMMDDVSAPHIEYPFRFVVEYHQRNEATETLALDQLSGGYRIVLALAADLAMRMAVANPHLRDPLQSEAIVVIDEIELHLHPEWQQRILGDLLRTFPNAQFIVSTHSPQVLTTVEPQHIVHLRASAKGILAEQETGPTFGAKSGDVLQAVMGVDQRPDNEFTRLLAAYQSMVSNGDGETPNATVMRAELDRMSRDPQLAALDIEIAHHRLMRELAKRT